MLRLACSLSLCCRDYAAGDLAEERLSSQGRQQQLGPNFYVRWDGTRAFYFTEVCGWLGAC